MNQFAEQYAQSGEGYLAMTHPVYKRRYAVSTDLMLGCRIGCDFCYYRFGPTAPYFGHGVALKPLATPESYWRALRDSALVNPDDLVIVSARSDMSMPEHYRAFLAFLTEHYDPTRKPLTFLILQRGAYTRRRAQELMYHPVLFGTTITPRAADKGFNRVMDDKQVRGLAALREAGVPAERISLELGPILPDTVDAAVKIARTLEREGIVAFLTYRGASIGQYGDYRNAIQGLVDRGFLKPEDLERAYTYFDGRRERKHEYYLVKNFLAPVVEDAFRHGMADSGLRIYRHTGHLYPNEFGISVAANRNNRVREEMMRYADRTVAASQVKDILETRFGYRDAVVETLRPAVFRIRGFATEDAAHAIGAALRVAVLFTEFRNQPTIEDVQNVYFSRSWLQPVN